MCRLQQWMTLVVGGCQAGAGGVAVGGGQPLVAEGEATLQGEAGA